MKIAIIVCTHGKLAQGLLSAVKMIYGNIENCYAVELEQDMGFEEYTKIIQETLDASSDSEHLFLVDIYAATPFNTVLSTMESRPENEIIYGINLPLLIEIIALRDRVDTLNEFRNELKAIVNDGKDSIGSISLKELMESH